MMSSSLRFRGKMMKVFADTGPPFLVHDKVLLLLSRVSINTTPDEEGDGAQEVNLRPWNEATVERFIEYAYTGDYHCPDPTLTSNRGASPGQGSNPAPPGNPPPPLPHPLTPLHKCFYAGPDPTEKISQANTFKTKHFDPVEHDFEAVFLAHAQIYSLASHLKINPLWTLALQRLLRTLINIGTVKPDWPMVSNFAKLVRFSYETTSSSGDPLRGIITQFAALNVTALNNNDMKNCIRDCGEFASELMEKVCTRLIFSEANEVEQVRSLKSQLQNEQRTSERLRAKLARIESTN